MRDSGPQHLSERRQSILRKASAALQGRIVTLWRVNAGRIVADVASGPVSPADPLARDVVGVLAAWGVALNDGSLWVACRDDAHQWHVARVRADVPAPPPPGAPRRCSERVTLELTGLLLGALERVWRTADQATVYLCSALNVLDLCLGSVRDAEGLTTAARARLLADLAGVASAIDGALSAA